MPDDVVRAIEHRAGFVDGVVVTGGEPLIHGQELIPFIRRLRDVGMMVKLDTNGYEIEVLHEVLAQGLIDFVAMDVKTSLSRYEQAAGRSLNVRRIREAVTAILESGVAHEFRTTCVPGLVQEEDVCAIGSLLGSGARYVLQQFRNTSAALLDPRYAGITPYPSGVLQSFRDAIRPFVASVTVRGL